MGVAALAYGGVVRIEIAGFSLGQITARAEDTSDRS
jgi:hypothetical protein